MEKYKFSLSLAIVCMSIFFLTNSSYAATHAISGRVFNDKNCNGQLNGPDTGIAGVTMTLNPGAITTLTAGDGTYSFPGLVMGSYTVKETLPGGYCATTPTKVAVTIKNKKVTNIDFGDSQSTISPPDLCCPAP